MMVRLPNEIARAAEREVVMEEYAAFRGQGYTRLECGPLLKLTQIQLTNLLLVARRVGDKRADL